MFMPLSGGDYGGGCHSLLYSIQVAERAFDQAGRYRLSEDEKELLRSAGVINPAEVDGFWRDNIENSPRAVGLNE